MAKSKVHKRGPAKAAMNITPLIDVTFQLIMFFMLVNNIAADEAIRLKVPALEDPKTRELGDVNRIIISVTSSDDYDDKAREANPLAFDPRARIISVGFRSWDLNQITMDDAMKELAEILEQEKARDPDVQVLLRGDAALHYQEIEPIMATITGAKIGTVNLVAELPQD